MPAHAAGRAEATKLVKLVKEHCWISTFGGRSGGIKLRLAKERRGGSVDGTSDLRHMCGEGCGREPWKSGEPHAAQTAYLRSQGASQRIHATTYPFQNDHGITEVSPHYHAGNIWLSIET